MWRRSLLARLVVAAMVCAFISTADAHAQRSSALIERRSNNASTAAPATMPFEPSEELVYQAEFSKLVLRGIHIAEFKFTAGRAASTSQVNSTTTSSSSNNTTATNGDAVSPNNPTAASATNNVANGQGKPLPAPLFFTGDIVSRGWFRKLFGINFHYRVESTVEPEGFKILRTNKLDEQGKRVRISEAVFDRAQNSISWTERDPNDVTRPPRVVNSPLQGASHDIITAIYFLRTQTLTHGKTFELMVSDSGRVFRVPARVFAEKKKMKSVVGRVAVVRVDVEMFGEGRLVEDDGRLSIWFTDDARRLPIRARISSDPGTLDITLKSFKKQ
jgi:hypothetical protein